MVKYLGDYDGFHILDEMALVGVTDSNIEIYIYTNDGGKIPHFHFRDLDKNRDNEGAIKLTSAEYFKHGKYKAELNSKQRKDLVEFLMSKRHNKRYSGTNWNYIVDMWNDNNSDVYLDEDTEMPDYRNIK